MERRSSSGRGLAWSALSLFRFLAGGVSRAKKLAPRIPKHCVDSSRTLRVRASTQGLPFSHTEAVQHRQSLVRLREKEYVWQHRSFTHESQADKAGEKLTPHELRRGATFAHLSGLCYLAADQLRSALQAEGLTLVAQGATHFTQWYVADGPIRDSAPAASSATTWALQQHPRQAAAQAAGHPADAAPLSGNGLHMSGPAPGSPEPRREPGGAESWGGEAGAGGRERERVVAIRGVVWRTAGVELGRLWQNLMRFWPSEFAPDDTRPSGALLAHTGCASMAWELFPQLLPMVAEADAAGMRVTFCGHSLGGALGVLLLVLARLRVGLDPGLAASVSFGSPPVLAAHATGADAGNKILQVLDLPAEAIQSYVLDNDPVPRAMLSADPAWVYLSQTTPVSLFLRARQAVFGAENFLTPSRSLFCNVGHVILVRWSPSRGYMVQTLAPDAVDEQLRLALGEIVRTPAALLQALLDHTHGSYAQELAAAARQLELDGSAYIHTPVPRALG